ncbi:MAG TPA: DUF4258 domain-containing protein [Candidatus Kapabacteria bacterium]|nr:DUF4258 domain-containing protein [Candidatus Kapabacteria bacterium]
MIYTIHRHALESMAVREISPESVEKTIQSPEQTYIQEDGLTVLQSRIPGPRKKPHLLRVIIDMNENPPLVVISTSKVSKYWRKQ